MNIMPHAYIADGKKIKRSFWERIKKDFFRKYETVKSSEAFIVGENVFVSPDTYKKLFGKMQ